MNFDLSPKPFTFNDSMKLSQFNAHQWPPTRFLFAQAKKLVVPGLNGATIYDLGSFFYHEFYNLNLFERVAVATYNFLMAIPSIFLFIFSLFPYLPFKHIDKTIYNIIQLITPNRSIYLNVRNVIADFLAKQHHSSLSFSILLVIYFSSSGVAGFMACFDKSQTLYKKRDWFQRRWSAIKLTLMLLVLNTAIITLLILQNIHLNPIIKSAFHSVFLIKTISFVLLILLIFMAISLIYTYGPSLTHRFPFISKGSFCATIASVTATLIFFYLVNNFLNYNQVYGSLGTLIAFMVWVWINTVIILLGFELNVSLHSGKLSGKRHNK